MLHTWTTPLLLAAGLTVIASAQDEPALPIGLGASGPGSADEPDLPEGLGAGTSSDEPELPSGLFGDDDGRSAIPSGEDNGRSGVVFDDVEDEMLAGTFGEPGLGDIRGFLDLRVGRRLNGDPDQSRFSLGEARLQTEWSRDFDGLFASARVDWLYDAIARDPEVLPDDGHGYIDVREAYGRGAPLDWLEITAGRQILTWGTGDLVFLNDLFPKDFSYFLGRDAEYLKAPSDAVKVSTYSDAFNLDVIWSPWFDPDRFPDGRRQSIFNPFVGGIAGRSQVLPRSEPDNGELALRVTRAFDSVETALYGYHGYWKNPLGIDFPAMEAFFPRMSAYGASVRAPHLGGISNVEVTYYDSRTDRSGTDPFVENSRAIGLVGHERSIATDLTLGLQYLVEMTDEHDALVANAPPGFPVRDEFRSLYTVRFTYLTHRQKARWSLFWMHSPTDEDFFARPSVTYDYSDRIKLELGANLLGGQENFTPLGQLERTTNVFAALRFSF